MPSPKKKAPAKKKVVSKKKVKKKDSSQDGRLNIDLERIGNGLAIHNIEVNNLSPYEIKMMLDEVYIQILKKCNA